MNSDRDDAMSAQPRRELSRFDTVFFMISAIVVLDTMGAIAVGGAQAFTWLVVLFVFFFVPSALVCAELGAAIPAEGGVYVWVRRAFGQFAGSLTSFLYWAGVPVWLGGSVAIVAMSVYERFIGHLSMAGLYLFGAVFVAIATAGAMLPLRWGKWIPTSGAIGQIVLLTMLTTSVVLYGIRHGFHGIAIAEFAPSRAVFITVIPVLLFSFVGVELPSAAGEEMRDPRRDLPVAIARAGAVQAVMYGVPILAVLLVIPADQITSLHGLIDALATVLTVFGGSVAAGGAATLTGAGVVIGWGCALIFIWVLIASGSAWIMGAGRAQAAACADGGGPRYFARFSTRTGVPVRMAVTSGLASLLTVVICLLVTGRNADKYFSVALTVSIAVVLLAYLLVFPAFAMLRFREPDLDRPFRAPGGMWGMGLITVLTTGWSLLAGICLLWPGLGTAQSDALLPSGFHGERAQFEILVLTPLVILVAVIGVYHRVSQRRGTTLSTSPSRAPAGSTAPTGSTARSANAVIDLALTPTVRTGSISLSYHRAEALKADAATVVSAAD